MQNKRQHYARETKQKPTQVNLTIGQTGEISSYFSLNKLLFENLEEFVGSYIYGNRSYTTLYNEVVFNATSVYISNEMTQKLQAPDFPTLWKVVDRLEKANISYMLTGSMAVNAYGHARATNDFDMVIQVGLGDVKNLSKLFEKDFYINEEAIREAIQNESMFNIIDNETIFKVDFIIAKTDTFSKQQFDRRQKIKFVDKTIYVISPEDLILSKLDMKKSDTSPETQKYYDELWQKLSFEERFLKGLQWIQFNREFLLAGIRSRFPHFTETEIKQELKRELYDN